MQPELAAFLAGQTPQAEETTVWGHGHFAFRVTGYLTPETPPLEYVTSVRSLVFRGDAIQCMCDAAGIHLFPGGRREAGETLEETLRREVLEETGCRLTAVSRLGFLWFHHLNPAPPGYRYPHPDFVQLVSMAEAVGAARNTRTTESDEDQCEIHPIAEVQALALSPSQHLFLEAALKARRRQS